MQRKITRKLSETLHDLDDEGYRRRHQQQFPTPQPPYYAPPQPPPPQSGPGHPYDHPRPPQTLPAQISNKFYQEQHIPFSIPTPSGVRIAANLSTNDYYQNQHDRHQPQDHPHYSNSPDNLSDDVSLDDYFEEPSDRDRDSYFDDSHDRHRDRDRDRDYRGRSSSVPPARIRSRDRVHEDESGVKLKAKKSSKSFLPMKKHSKSKSISFKDSDIYTSSGSSRSSTSRGSHSHGSSSTSSRPRSGSSSQVSLGGHRSQDGRKYSSTRVASSPSRHGPASNSSSREVMALPIEIPESVTDADAFRRYLSRSESSMESVGISGSTDPLAKNLNHLGLSIHRRTMALSQAIMTLALLSASASQLRFVVAYSHAQSYPALNYFLICTCIIVEIVVGIGYVVLSRFEFTDTFVEKVHSYLIFGLFVVAVANVIIASFALDDHVCEGKGRGDQYEAVEQSPPQNPP